MDACVCFLNLLAGGEPHTGASFVRWPDAHANSRVEGTGSNKMDWRMRTSDSPSLVCAKPRSADVGSDPGSGANRVVMFQLGLPDVAQSAGMLLNLGRMGRALLRADA